MAEDEQTVAMPLVSAYGFGSEHGLESEMGKIAGMKIEWELSYTSTVRRGYIVELFEKNSIFEEFKAKHWTLGNTIKGEREKKKYLRVKQMYDDFLEGRSAVSEEVEEEAEQQFAAEEDLRDFLARNPSCIEQGLQLYQSDKKAVEFAVETGRIDLLAVDKNQKFVVVELKLGKGRDKALGQILRYMGWVDENLGKGPCRGIIIAKDIPDDLVRAVRRVPGVSLCRYSVSVAVELVAPKG